MAEFHIYEQGTCIGAVEAPNKEKAWEVAKQYYGLNDKSPVFLQEVHQPPTTKEIIAQQQ